MKYIPFLLGAAIVALLTLGFSAYNQAPAGATPSTVSSSTSINQLYTEVNNIISSLFSTSTANTFTALQTFNGGIVFTTATGTSATSTLSAGVINATELRVTSSTIQTTLVVNGSVSGNMIVTGAVQSNTLNVTSTSVFGANIQGTNAIFSGLGTFNTLNVTSTSVFGGNIQGTNAIFSGLGAFNTLNVTSTSVFGGLATFDSVNITNGNEYRRHSASVIIVNPSATIHSTGTVTVFFPNAAIINSIGCHSRPSGSSTIIMDRRVSSTPATVGDTILTSFECTTTAAASSTFTSSTMTAGSILNIKINGVSGSPSSTTIFVNFTNND